MAVSNRRGESSEIAVIARVGLRSYIAEPNRGARNWNGKEAAKAAVYGNRRRIKGERGKRLQRQRGERIERNFAHGAGVVLAVASAADCTGIVKVAPEAIDGAEKGAIPLNPAAAPRVSTSHHRQRRRQTQMAGRAHRNFRWRRLMSEGDFKPSSRDGEVTSPDPGQRRSEYMLPAPA